MSRFRTGVVRHVHSPRWRSISTYTEPSPRNPTLRPPSHRHTRSKQGYPEEHIRSLHPRMIFVRPWDGIPSMVHAFAIIREIESRFGKVQEFVVLRVRTPPHYSFMPDMLHYRTLTYRRPTCHTCMRRFPGLKMLTRYR